MTAEEYTLSGFDNINCRFILKDGSEHVGVVSNFFPQEPHSFYLVCPANLIAFDLHRRYNDDVAMKQHCRQIDLDEIREIEKY